MPETMCKPICRFGITIMLIYGFPSNSHTKPCRVPIYLYLDLHLALSIQLTEERCEDVFLRRDISKRDPGLFHVPDLQNIHRAVLKLL